MEYLGRQEHGLILWRALNGDIYNYVSKMEHVPISPQIQDKWIPQAAEALVFIHSKDFIHCDIHPRNFLLDSELDVQLRDFAGSLFTSLDGKAMESTKFFLPRDWRDASNTKTNLFPFGSFMYYIVTGREPYADLPDEEVTTKFGLGIFPDTEALIFRNTIKGCWEGELKSSEVMLEAIVSDGLIET